MTFRPNEYWSTAVHSKRQEEVILKEIYKMRWWEPLKCFYCDQEARLLVTYVGKINTNEMPICSYECQEEKEMSK